MSLLKVLVSLGQFMSSSQSLIDQFRHCRKDLEETCLESKHGPYFRLVYSEEQQSPLLLLSSLSLHVRYEIPRHRPWQRWIFNVSENPYIFAPVQFLKRRKVGQCAIGTNELIRNDIYSVTNASPSNLCTFNCSGSFQIILALLGVSCLKNGRKGNKDEFNAMIDFRQRSRWRFKSYTLHGSFFGVR